jgi:hypothetical protein
MALAASTSLTPAIFGLLGVVVGALLNWIVTTQRDRAASRRAERAVGRLMRSEMNVLKVQLHHARAESRFHAIGGSRLSTRVWEDSKRLLAETLPSDAWNQVAIAYMLVNELQGAFGEYRASERLVAQAEGPLEHTIRAVGRAQDALKPVGRTPAEIQQAEARLQQAVSQSQA